MNNLQADKDKDLNRKFLETLRQKIKIIYYLNTI